MFPKSLDAYLHESAPAGAYAGHGHGHGRGRGSGVDGKRGRSFAGAGAGGGAGAGAYAPARKFTKYGSGGGGALVPLPPVVWPLLVMDHETMSELSADQRAAAALLADGKNVFVTGPGGCGKSRLIQCVMAATEAAGNHAAVAATTGIAAKNIGGCTLHSLLGMTPNTDLGTILSRLSAKKKNALRLIQLLIVDEVSMLSAEDLSTAMAILRSARGDALPVLMFVGDFLQLGPVGGTISLDSKPWRDLQLQVALLRTNFRQQRDVAFDAMLNELRMGRVSDATVAALQSRVGRTVARDGIEPTELLPRVAGVEAKNAAMLAALPQPHVRYVMEVFFATWSPLGGVWARALGDRAAPCSVEDGGMPLPANAELPLDHALKFVHLHGLGSRRDDEVVLAAARAALAKTSLAPMLTLAVGAQIVFTVNVDPPLIVNGTRGCVEEFDPVDGLPIVRLMCGTLHKVMPTVHTSKLPHGMRVQQLAEETADASAKPAAKTKLVNTIGVSQLPLQLAFALTVHRAQGMTLELGYANLGTEVFGDGLAYVALSRFPGFNNFALTAFTPGCVRVNRAIVAWYEAANLLAVGASDA